MQHGRGQCGGKALLWAEKSAAFGHQLPTRRFL
jgi:hypothetical protein